MKKYPKLSIVPQAILSKVKCHSEISKESHPFQGKPITKNTKCNRERWC